MGGSIRTELYLPPFKSSSIGNFIEALQRGDTIVMVGSRSSLRLGLYDLDSKKVILEDLGLSLPVAHGIPPQPDVGCSLEKSRRDKGTAKGIEPCRHVLLFP